MSLELFLGLVLQAVALGLVLFRVRRRHLSYAGVSSTRSRNRLSRNECSDYADNPEESNRCKKSFFSIVSGFTAFAVGI